MSEPVVPPQQEQRATNTHTHTRFCRGRTKGKQNKRNAPDRPKEQHALDGARPAARVSRLSLQRCGKEGGQTVPVAPAPASRRRLLVTPSSGPAGEAKDTLPWQAGACGRGGKGQAFSWRGRKRCGTRITRLRAVPFLLPRWLGQLAHPPAPRTRPGSQTAPRLPRSLAARATACKARRKGQAAWRGPHQ